jgi:hypothetical protein
MSKHHPQRRRWLTVGLVAAAASLALIVGVALSEDDSRDATDVASQEPERAPESSAATGSTSGDSRTTTTREPTTTSEPTTLPSASPPAPEPPAGDDEAPSLGSTEDCRADPACPSSEHRTSDPCGAALIADQSGYLEGRRDAERGLPYQIDAAPDPTPADDDDDDGTVGPQTRYRAGYVQGWCDGGGDQV